MYKNTEKQLNFLLDKAMDNLDSLNDKLNYYGNAGYRFKELFYKNNGILTTEMQKKIIDILEIQQCIPLLEVLQNKEYKALGKNLINLLNTQEPYYNCKIIETLYKMENFQYIKEIDVFTESDCQYLKSAANKYIKKAVKIAIDTQRSELI